MPLLGMDDTCGCAEALSAGCSLNLTGLPTHGPWISINILLNHADGELDLYRWKSTHNVHHIVVNTADSDPDIQASFSRSVTIVTIPLQYAPSPPGTYA